MANPLSELPRPANSASGLNAAQVCHSRNTTIVSRDVAGETIVVPICRGVGDLDSVYTFNEVGRSLWKLLESGRTVDELANWVAANYEVNSDQALSDVQNYIAELQEAGLIRSS
ncbi:MAG TPA: PqqD family protein [Candidatus Solibacter sp.]|nr:PqqD family protein [Candidatus Solibacter sp.]